MYCRFDDAMALVGRWGICFVDNGKLTIRKLKKNNCGCSANLS